MVTNFLLESHEKEKLDETGDFGNILFPKKVDFESAGRDLLHKMDLNEESQHSINYMNNSL